MTTVFVAQQSCAACLCTNSSRTATSVTPLHRAPLRNGRRVPDALDLRLPSILHVSVLSCLRCNHRLSPLAFSVQPTPETRKKQVQMWLELILGYCRAHSTFEIDANDSSFALWHNEKIKRASCSWRQTDDRSQGSLTQPPSGCYSTSSWHKVRVVRRADGAVMRMRYSDARRRVAL